MNKTFGAPSRARSGCGHAGDETSKVRPMTPLKAVPGLYSFIAKSFLLVSRRSRPARVDARPSCVRMVRPGGGSAADLLDLARPPGLDEPRLLQVGAAQDRRPHSSPPQTGVSIAAPSPRPRRAPDRPGDRRPGHPPRWS